METKTKQTGSRGYVRWSKGRWWRCTESKCKQNQCKLHSCQKLQKGLTHDLIKCWKGNDSVKLCSSDYTLAHRASANIFNVNSHLFFRLLFSSATPELITAPATSQQDQAANEAQARASVTLDPSQAVTNIQIRLADGGRLVQSFNHTHRWLFALFNLKLVCTQLRQQRSVEMFTGLFTTADLEVFRVKTTSWHRKTDTCFNPWCCSVPVEEPSTVNVKSNV